MTTGYVFYECAVKLRPRERSNCKDIYCIMCTQTNRHVYIYIYILALVCMLVVVRQYLLCGSHSGCMCVVVAEHMHIYGGIGSVIIHGSGIYYGMYTNAMEI